MDAAQSSTFRDYIYQSLLGLATEDGINASGKDEIYGCIFGRDSALTILKILRVHKKLPSDELLQVCRRALLTLCTLQGKEVNIESGEEPGKFIHEFRKEKFEHLTSLSKPWYLYPDGILRNYDSIDSTALVLIALYRYWEINRDSQFLITVLPHVEMGLNWIITFGDKDKDGLLDYALHAERKHGGLAVQSWTDSHESLRGADGLFPAYPIAPVEAQSYAWLAMRLWSRFYSQQFPTFAHKLSAQAKYMKKAFNKSFIFQDGDFYFAGQAVDGRRNLIKTVTGNPLICLWAADQINRKAQSIIDGEYIESLTDRAFQPDLFDPEAGIRTMSRLSPTFNPRSDSYHNGSFWPVLNGLATEGLENFGFGEKATLLKNASLKPLYHFNSPIELYMRDEAGNFREYLSGTGQTGCRVQAWSAASALDWLT
jgi:glycogen debranching enzyme